MRDPYAEQPTYASANANDKINYAIIQPGRVLGAKISPICLFGIVLTTSGSFTRFLGESILDRSNM